MTSGENSQENSVVLRYAHRLGIVSAQSVNRCSLREGAAITQGPTVDGVALNFLDLTSRTTTGTFKDWLGCVTAAYCFWLSCKAEFAGGESVNF